ncbi:MAG: hypothetical protein IJW24_01480 [Clostridia bacterium]|nr:hypothetical protein [Clostridia bacterium]
MGKKNEKGGLKYIISFLTLAVLWLVSIVLFACSVISIIPFVILFALSFVLMLIVVMAYIKFRKKQIEKLKKVELVKGNLSDEDLINLYNLAGIPVIRDENGKIKNIYELLALEVLYDENGNRIRTIYELLGIVPRFDKNGKEVPTVLSIKNRVGSFIKPQMKSGVLTRVLTEQEKEDLLVKQMLEEKLKQAKESGDDKKAKTIAKVIGAKKKEEKKSSSSKTPKIILAKGKAVKMGKVSEIKAPPTSNFFKDIIALAGIVEKKVKEAIQIPESEKSKPKEFEGFRLPKQSDQRSQPQTRRVPRGRAFYGFSNPIKRGYGPQRDNSFMNLGDENEMGR